MDSPILQAIRSALAAGRAGGPHQRAAVVARTTYFGAVSAAPARLAQLKQITEG
jgi:hypothetical protein